ncbi:Checkpoint kinase 2, partial [Cladochytrium tenue]
MSVVPPRPSTTPAATAAQAAGPAWGHLVSLNPPDLPSQLLTRVAGPGLDPSTVAYLFGRHRDCDVVIHNQQLSKRHCVVYKDASGDPQDRWDGPVFLEDMSTNGTFVNGEKIVKGIRHELKDGDELQLARGPLGIVRLAHHKDSDRTVAAKLLSKSRYGEELAALGALAPHSKTLIDVDHPCVARVSGVFDSETSVNVVSEFVTGECLFDVVLERRRLSEDDCRVVGLQILLALRYMHQRGMAHGNLKPENILLESNNTATPDDPAATAPSTAATAAASSAGGGSGLLLKLGDFGLHGLIGGAALARAVRDSPDFAAPEAVGTGADVPKPPADLWSCGAVLYL